MVRRHASPDAGAKAAKPAKPVPVEGAAKPRQPNNSAARVTRASTASPPDIARVLRERIALQQIPPGSKLSENDLAAEFRVPRTRAREALAVLEQRGLVERIPNRGAVVVRLEIADLAQLYEVREVLEGLCARMATIHGDRKLWQETLRFFEGPMAGYVADGDIDAYIAGYEAFRRQMVESAGNQVLTEMLDSILDKTQALIRRIIILPGRAAAGLQEHTHLLQAMCRGDADEAERLRRLNMRSAKAYLDRYQKYIL